MTLTRRRIVFHIGLAKTGTTSFQYFCHRHRSFLARHGVLYPKRETGRFRNHAPLAASYIAHRSEGPTVALRWRPRAKAVRTLRAEIEASTAETALISSEHLSMHLDRSEALELAADFAACDCVIVIVLRDAYAHFLSTYNTHVTAGGFLPIEAYARSVLIPGTRYMSAKETILIWQEAFGTERIQIIDYDATPDVVGAILRVCGIDGPLPSASRTRRRESLGPGTIEALRAANEVIAARQSVAADRSVASWAQLSLFSILCRRRLVHACGGLGRQGGWTISRKTMQALDEIAAADQHFVADTYGIELRGDAVRDRVVVADPPTPDKDDMRRAEALVGRVTLGLWAPSQALVALADRIVKWRSVVR